MDVFFREGGLGALVEIASSITNEGRWNLFQQLKYQLHFTGFCMPREETPDSVSVKLLLYKFLENCFTVSVNKHIIISSHKLRNVYSFG